jgi:hypothetical protein
MRYCSVLAVAVPTALGINTARAEQPPAPCHPNPNAAMDDTTVASRGDVVNLPQNRHYGGGDGIDGVSSAPENIGFYGRQKQQPFRAHHTWYRHFPTTPRIAAKLSCPARFQTHSGRVSIKTSSPPSSLARRTL